MKPGTPWLLGPLALLAARALPGAVAASGRGPGLCGGGSAGSRDAGAHPLPEDHEHVVPGPGHPGDDPVPAPRAHRGGGPVVLHELLPIAAAGGLGQAAAACGGCWGRRAARAGRRREGVAARVCVASDLAGKSDGRERSALQAG